MGRGPVPHQLGGFLSVSKADSRKTGGIQGYKLKNIRRMMERGIQL
jgi:hypothetical protein